MNNKPIYGYFSVIKKGINHQIWCNGKYHIMTDISKNDYPVCKKEYEKVVRVFKVSKCICKG